jgi:hypothetical protein
MDLQAMGKPGARGWGVVGVYVDRRRASPARPRQRRQEHSAQRPGRLPPAGMEQAAAPAPPVAQPGGTDYRGRLPLDGPPPGTASPFGRIPHERGGKFGNGARDVRPSPRSGRAFRNGRPTPRTGGPAPFHASGPTPL